MNRLFFFLVLFIYTVGVSATVVDRPNPKYPDSAYKNHAWLADYQKSKVFITLNENAKKFISEDSLLRYFRLKMRNFVGDFQIVDTEETGIGYNYLSIKVELFKYNHEMKIYYGLMSLVAEGSIFADSRRTYFLVNSIAGSDNQIKGFIKEEIDSMVEVYAEDYYFVKDLVAKKRAESKEPHSPNQ
jgi:hypothetical protein